MQVIIAMMIKKEYSYKTSYKAGLVYDQSLLRIRKNQREKKESERKERKKEGEGDKGNRENVWCEQEWTLQRSTGGGIPS